MRGDCCESRKELAIQQELLTSSKHISNLIHRMNAFVPWLDT